MLKPCLPVTSTIKGLRGSFQTWHDLEVKGRQAQSTGHKYLPTHSSLRALGGPGLRLGGTPINPPPLTGFPSALPATGPSWELLQPLLPPVVAEISLGAGPRVGVGAGVGGCLGGCLGGSRESKPGLQRGGGQSPLLPLLVARAQTPPPARCPAVAVPPLPSPTQRPLNTHPHALESGQCPQGTKGPQRPQGFDGSQFCVAQPVGHQADDGDLQRERGGQCCQGAQGPRPTPPPSPATQSSGTGPQRGSSWTQL